MLAAFMTSRVRCSKQARSCLRSPAVQAESFVPFSGGSSACTCTFHWLSLLASALHTFRLLWIEPSLNDQACCCSPFLDGRSVPFVAPGPRSGGDMQILTCFKFFLVADSFGSAFPAREQKEV